MNPTNSCTSKLLQPEAIKRLDQTVVNRIAAGEVIQRPANAIKEMMENSIDAKSTNIQITVKEGGLKLIQIQDNGTGIGKEDLNLVCERFATSKLREFEDLQTISTFGFRGEAMASISHIAHVTIKTKTVDTPCAYQVNYCDGVPKGNPKPCAGNQGTLILVEDLYYNIPIRRRAFQNYSSEYAKIVEVVSRYAVHNSSIGFTVKKHGETVSDVKTTANSTTLGNIRSLFGIDKSKELLDIQLNNETLQFKINGYISSVNHNSKRTIFILFINHRLVESNALRKAIDAVYNSYLPKNQFPFIYMSLEIHPLNVDVNVHPTKQEVHFLNEGPIIESIQKLIEERLLSCCSSRAMLIQAVLPNMKEIKEINIKSSNAEEGSNKEKKVYDYNLVRTDSKEQKLDMFLRKEPANTPDRNANKVANLSSGDNGSNNTLTNVPYRRLIQLNSVFNLRKVVQDSSDSGLVQIFSNYTFVGCADRQFTLIQHQTKLYLLNITKLSEEFFYQVMLRDFGNFSVFELTEPAPIRELVELALTHETIEWRDNYGPKETFPQTVMNLLVSKSAMLKDYFSFEIDKEGNICGIPYLLNEYYPAIEELPMLIFRLGVLVNWESEQDCFEMFCRQMAQFYRFPEFQPLDFKSKDDAMESSNDNQENSWKLKIEHILFPAFRKAYLPSKQNLTNGCVLQIANLPDLYKVFERC